MTRDRGGAWVVVQFALMAAIVAGGVVGPGWPTWTAGALSVVGTILAVAGGVIALLAARALGSALTPFPRPSTRGRLVERGPYRVVRHPIYLAGVLFFTGVSLRFSPVALGLTIVLAVLWTRKALLEEGLLRTRYSGYEEYERRVRFRLLPGVW